MERKCEEGMEKSAGKYGKLEEVRGSRENEGWDVRGN